MYRDEYHCRYVRSKTDSALMRKKKNVLYHISVETLMMMIVDDSLSQR